MKISTRGRYALRVMLDLAINDDGGFISLKDIAKRQEISNKYLEQIISMLNKSGYLKAARGYNGGYRLAKKPNEYKIGDILRVTEGELIPTECVLDNGKCSRKDICKTQPFWKGLEEVITNYIDGKTLADLM